MTVVCNVDLLLPSWSYPTNISQEQIIEECRNSLGLSTKHEIQLFHLKPISQSNCKSTLLQSQENDCMTRYACLIAPEKLNLEFLEYSLDLNRQLSEKLEKSVESLRILQNKIDSFQLQNEILKRENQVLKQRLDPHSNRYEITHEVIQEEGEEMVNNNSKIKKTTQLPEKKTTTTLTIPIKSRKRRTVSSLDGSSSTDRIIQTITQNTSKPDPKIQTRKETGRLWLPGLEPKSVPTKILHTARTSDEEFSRCRLCSCIQFRGVESAGWVCCCGHTNVKHSSSRSQNYFASSEV